MIKGKRSGRQGGVSLDGKREWLGMIEEESPWMTRGETLCHNELEKSY
jgi:hypothetical protein